MMSENLASAVRRRCLGAVFLLCSLAAFSTAHASVASLNVAGDGWAGAMPVSAPVNVQGSGFVLAQPNPGNPASFVFSELGAYRLTQPDGVSALGSRDLTLTYSVSGLLDPVTGGLSFSSGAFSLYADTQFNFASSSSNPLVVFGANDGDLIASFQIGSGGGFAYGGVHMAGQAIAGTIRPGYFFSAAGDDLSVSGNLQFVVDIGNVLDDAPSATVVSEIVCKGFGFPGPGCDSSSYANTPYYFVVKDGGLASLSSADAVPEPGSMALALFGLTGVGAFVRRTRKSESPAKR